MIRKIINFIIGLVLGILAFIAGICTIAYIMTWDFIREKTLRKKPIKSPCFEKILEKNENINRSIAVVLAEIINN